MKFFGQGWCALGTRKDRSSDISKITHIPKDILEVGMKPRPYWDGELNLESDLLNNYSVAQKMSWAAIRHCTKVEDSAYCLLGIFDINMPLLYGEGEKAFMRLQEEIFRATDDHSLLAWTIRRKSECWELGSVFGKQFPVVETLKSSLPVVEKPHKL
jgi:hypothetical protein